MRARGRRWEQATVVGMRWRQVMEGMVRETAPGLWVVGSVWVAGCVGGPSGVEVCIHWWMAWGGFTAEQKKAGWTRYASGIWQTRYRRVGWRMGGGVWWVIMVGQWQQARGVDTTWTSVVGDGGNAVGRAMAGVWAARAAVAATVVQRYIMRKWHGGWLEREGRELVCQSLRAATWNTQKLLVSRRWSGATNVKLEWLVQRLEDSQCDVVSLQEVDGSLHTLRRLRRWLAARGYEAAVLPGEGAVNGVAIAWRRDTLALQGNARALASRVLAVRLTRLADGMDFGVVAVHGMHGKVDDCCEQIREATGWLGGQKGGF